MDASKAATLPVELLELVFGHLQAAHAPSVSPPEPLAYACRRVDPVYEGSSSPAFRILDGMYRHDDNHHNKDYHKALDLAAQAARVDLTNVARVNKHCKDMQPERAFNVC